MKGNTFVRDVADRFRCDDRRAETLIFAVFQELRDRLTPAEAADVAAQLPSSLKMLWFSFDYPDRSVRLVHEYQFLEEVRRMVGLEDESRAERGGGFCIQRPAGGAGEPDWTPGGSSPRVRSITQVRVLPQETQNDALGNIPATSCRQWLHPATFSASVVYPPTLARGLRRI
jgi:Uncharacterized conserved protein (DUF2267)